MSFTPAQGYCKHATKHIIKRNWVSTSMHADPVAQQEVTDKLPTHWPCSDSAEAFLGKMKAEGRLGRAEWGRGRAVPWMGQPRKVEDLAFWTDPNPHPRIVALTQANAGSYFAGAGVSSPIRLSGAYRGVGQQIYPCPIVSCSCFLSWLGCNTGGQPVCSCPSWN